MTNCNKKRYSGGKTRRGGRERKGNVTELVRIIGSDRMAVETGMEVGE
jgi:hypothetical protein